MNSLLFRRMLAVLIDYMIILIYAMVLFLLVNWIFAILEWDARTSPYWGQAIGFFTLTLPVFVYSWLSEKSRWKATVGKKIMHIKVVTDQLKSSKQILIRNFLKYLPWEIAHIGVHWMFYYSELGRDTPLWVWITLIVPQLVVIVYIVSIFSSKGVSSLYDRYSKTKLVVKG